tara:strand:- start:314 stop:727 length:414 start_codon:yes stop_codon:yes gene_type:complete
MPYGKSNKSIQDSAFKLRSNNTTPFKQMGSNPQDRAVDKLATRTDLSKVDFEKKLAKITKTVDPYPAKKSSMPKNFNMTGSSKAGKFIKWAKKGGKFLGGKALGVAGMLSSTLSHADQPKKGKGKVEYPGGKIDFTK